MKRIVVCMVVICSLLITGCNFFNDSQKIFKEELNVFEDFEINGAFKNMDWKVENEASASVFVATNAFLSIKDGDNYYYHSFSKNDLGEIKTDFEKWIIKKEDGIYLIIVF